MRTSLIIVPLLLLMLAGGASATPLQAGFRVDYEVSRDGLTLGRSVRQLVPAGDGYWNFSARTKPTGLAAVLLRDRIEESSRLRMDGGGIQPLSYRYQRHGGRKEQQYELAFDGDSGQLRFVHDGNRTIDAPASLDPLSFLVAVMQRLGQHEQRFVLPIAGRRSVDAYRFETLEKGDLETPLGRIGVVHVRATHPDNDSHYDLWCAPALDYLPVRISHHDGGETTDLRLNRYTELQQQS